MDDNEVPSDRVRPQGKAPTLRPESENAEWMRRACLQCLAAYDQSWGLLSMVFLKAGTKITADDQDVDSLDKMCKELWRAKGENPTGLHPGRVVEVTIDDEGIETATQPLDSTRAYVIKRDEDGKLEWPLLAWDAITFRAVKPTTRPDYTLLTQSQREDLAMHGADSTMRPWNLMYQTIEAASKARASVKKSKASSGSASTSVVKKSRAGGERLRILTAKSRSCGKRLQRIQEAFQSFRAQWIGTRSVQAIILSSYWRGSWRRLSSSPRNSLPVPTWTRRTF